MYFSSRTKKIIFIKKLKFMKLDVFILRYLLKLPIEKAHNYTYNICILNNY